MSASVAGILQGHEVFTSHFLPQALDPSPTPYPLNRCLSPSAVTQATWDESAETARWVCAVSYLSVPRQLRWLRSLGPALTRQLCSISCERVWQAAGVASTAHFTAPRSSSTQLSASVRITDVPRASEASCAAKAQLPHAACGGTHGWRGAFKLHALGLGIDKQGYERLDMCADSDGRASCSPWLSGCERIRLGPDDYLVLSSCTGKTMHVI